MDAIPMIMRFIHRRRIYLLSSAHAVLHYTQQNLGASFSKNCIPLNINSGDHFGKEQSIHRPCFADRFGIECVVCKKGTPDLINEKYPCYHCLTRCIKQPTANFCSRQIKPNDL